MPVGFAVGEPECDDYSGAWVSPYAGSVLSGHGVHPACFLGMRYGHTPIYQMLLVPAAVKQWCGLSLSVSSHVSNTDAGHIGLCGSPTSRIRKKTEDLLANMGRTWDYLLSNPQLRWLACAG